MPRPNPVFSTLLACALSTALMVPLPATPADEEVTGAIASTRRDGANAVSHPTPQPLTDATCNGSLVVLTPSIPPDHYAVASTDIDRGSFVMALKDFQICSMGIKLEIGSFPRTLNAYIYSSSVVTRGALLASGSVSVSGAGNIMHFVPINYTLEACQEYELVFRVLAGDHWEWWDVLSVNEVPFDNGGAVRVRYPSCGCPLTFGVPHIELVGNPVPSAPHTTDFAGPGATTTSTNSDQERGIFIRMLDTSRLCAFGMEADLVAGQTITATVYAATGAGPARGGVLAKGTYTVPSSGLQWHDVPINAQLAEGQKYDVAIAFGAVNGWPWWDENTFTEPFARDVFELVTSEQGGIGSNFALPHYRAKWEAHAGGAPFDLAPPQHPTPLIATQATGEFGAFITSIVRQGVYAIGWMADVPAGQVMTATVYNANGLIRDSFRASGSIVSGAGGMRWHDIPLSTEFGDGGQYDISISFTGATQWPYWDDRVIGVPYSNYGSITMRNSEYQGNYTNFALIHMRVHGCNAALTPVSDAPARTPMFLAAPAPNPAGDMSRVDFSLDEGGPVSLRVYDVSGRLVSTVIEGTRAQGWSSAEVDSRNFASGVYFLKLATPEGSVTRKFVVVR